MSEKYSLYTQQCVYEMMKALGLPLPNEDNFGLRDMNWELMRKLVSEEASEYDEAIVNLELAIKSENIDDILKWWAEVIDAICDIIVVVHNCSCSMGIDIKPYFDLVHRSNMAKVGGGTNEYGKKMKPEGWEPPDIKGMLTSMIYSGDDND